MNLPDKPVSPVAPNANSFGITEDRYLKIKDETNKIYRFSLDPLYIYLSLLVIVLSYFYGNFFTGLFGVFFVPLILSFLEKLYKQDRLAKIEDLPKFENYKKAIDIFSSQRRDYESALKNYQSKLNQIEAIKQRDLNRKNFGYWSSLDPYEFEREIAVLFDKHGFKTKVTKGSGDGGIDIILFKNSEAGIVQCKRHKTKVSPSVIRDIYGTMLGGKYKFAYVVCPAGFSEESMRFSRGKKIQLIGLKRIMEMVNSDIPLKFLE
jgi:hypothetical protein